MHPIAWLAVLALALAPACGESRAEQCVALIDKVNAVNHTVAHNGSAANADAMAALAIAIERGSSQLTALRFTDSELRRRRDDYVQTLEHIAASAKAMQQAAKEKNQAAMLEIVDRIQAAGRDEAVAVEQINRECRSQR